MLYEIVRGDTDGYIIDYIEANNSDDASEIALDKHHPEWRQNIQDPNYTPSTYEDTWGLIYARKASPIREQTKKWFREKLDKIETKREWFITTGDLLRAFWKEVVRRQGDFTTGPDFIKREPGFIITIDLALHSLESRRLTGAILLPQDIMISAYVLINFL